MPNPSGRKKQKDANAQFALPLFDLHAEYVRLVEHEKADAEEIEDTHTLQVAAELFEESEPTANEVLPIWHEPEPEPEVEQAPVVIVSKPIRHQPKKNRWALKTIGAVALMAIFTLTAYIARPVKSSVRQAPLTSLQCLQVHENESCEQPFCVWAPEPELVVAKREKPIPARIPDKAVPAFRAWVEQGREAIKMRQGDRAVSLLSKVRRDLLKSNAGDEAEALADANRLYGNALYLQAFDALRKGDRCRARQVITEAQQVSPYDEKIVEKARELSELAGC